MIKEVKYTSVWDDGIEITSNAKYNTETKEVFDIGMIEIEGVEILNEEYIVVDGEKLIVKEVDGEYYTI